MKNFSETTVTVLTISSPSLQGLIQFKNFLALCNMLFRTDRNLSHHDNTTSKVLYAAESYHSIPSPFCGRKQNSLVILVYVKAQQKCSCAKRLTIKIRFFFLNEAIEASKSCTNFFLSVRMSPFSN